MSNTILDVDENILKSKLCLTELSKENDDLNAILKNFETPEVPCVTFRPFPGVCIKTKTDTDDKVFINLCHTNVGIPPPNDISEEKLFSILEEENPSWVIPMSVGHERYENSKDGTPCLTYDIAINSDFFKRIKKQKHFLTFVILTMISAIESKHNKILKSQEYVILKNRTVTGTLHDHRVQKRKVRIPKPLIQEIGYGKKLKSNKFSSSLDTKNIAVDEFIQYVILRKPKQGNAEKLIGYFKLSTNQSQQADVCANVGEDRILIDVSEFNYVVDISVPFTIKQDEVTALLDRNQQILRLDMPLKKQQ